MQKKKYKVCAIIKDMYDKDIWFKKYADSALKRVGIKEGQTILDFGAGEGNYTFPVAKIIGTKGKVYAYERDVYSLKVLKKGKSKLKFLNIEIIKSDGKLPFPFSDKFFDVVLAYDILHSYYFARTERIKILNEISRIIKDNGFLSSFLKHISEIEFLKEAESAGFCLYTRIPLKLLHYGFLENGIILNFKKCSI